MINSEFSLTHHIDLQNNNMSLTIYIVFKNSIKGQLRYSVFHSTTNYNNYIFNTYYTEAEPINDNIVNYLINNDIAKIIEKYDDHQTYVFELTYSSLLNAL